MPDTNRTGTPEPEKTHSLVSSEVHLVTGGLGFIGSHLVDALVSSGKRVRIIDNLSAGTLANIVDAGNRHGDKIEVIVADIRDRSAVKKAMQGVSHVYHLAAINSIQRSVENPHDTMDANVLGTLNLIEAARKEMASTDSSAVEFKRFVFASSSSVYGDSKEFPRRESNEVSPLSPYALSKRVGEELCLMHHRTNGFPAVVMRYFNVFGPRQRATGDFCALIPIAIRKMLRGESDLKIWSGGNQTRDFTFVKTVVEATIRAAECEVAIGRIFNVASGVEISVSSILESIADGIGCPRLEMGNLPAKSGDVPRAVANISRMRDILGVEPRSVAEGLRETIAHYRDAQ